VGRSSAQSNGLIEMWCINGNEPVPKFDTSQLTYDGKAEVAVGRYTQCSPSQVRP